MAFQWLCFALKYATNNLDLSISKFGAGMLTLTWAAAAKERDRKEHLQGIANFCDTVLSDTQNKNMVSVPLWTTLNWLIVKHCCSSSCCQEKGTVL